jgi:hypothetical protein
MRFAALLCVLALLLAGITSAQEPADEPATTPPADAAETAETDDPLAGEGELEDTWDSYKIKAYSIELSGGLFQGDEYLNLPVMGDQTQVEAGTQRVMSYDGTWWELDELDYENTYDGPIKELEDGITAGLRIGSYLTDSFHLDLAFSYTKTEAVLTMMNQADEDNVFREEIDRDDDVQILRGAIEMMYDIDGFGLLGFEPYLGFGFGGVITRFSNLEDEGGLFLTGTAGMRGRLMGDVSTFVQFNMTTFGMGRDELHYAKTVTFFDVSAGLSFFVDVVPGDVRERHEAEMAERRRAR